MRKLNSHKITPVSNGLEITVHDKPGPGGASHMYNISGMTYNDNTIFRVTSHESKYGYIGHSKEVEDKNTLIVFQHGPMQEINDLGNPNGVNGLTESALLSIVEDRLACFQAGEFACMENQQALLKIQEALMWLHKRTLDRERRGVQGTYQK